MNESVFLAFGVVAIIWFILQIIGSWKLFKKAGKPGWLSLIPLVNIYTEYAICWKGGYGILMIIALIVGNSISQQSAEGSSGMMAVVCIAVILAICLQIVESHKLAKAFGKGMGYTLLLILLDRLGRIMLGFGSAQYIGKR